MFCFRVFPQYLQIFPEGMLWCGVAPPVFKAKTFPWVPQQIDCSVPPAGKEAPSLLGFGCHAERRRSTFDISCLSNRYGENLLRLYS